MAFTEGMEKILPSLQFISNAHSFAFDLRASQLYLCMYKIERVDFNLSLSNKYK